MISPGFLNENTSGLGFAVEQIAHSLSSQLNLTIIQPEDIKDQNETVDVDSNLFKDESVVKDLIHIPVDDTISPYSYVVEEEKEQNENVRKAFEFFTKNVIERVQNLNFDLIYAHDWVTFQAGKELKERSGIPLVVHVHSLDVDRISPTNHSWVFDIEKSTFEAANVIISVSNYCSKRIGEFYSIPKQKIHTIYNGCSLTLFPNYEKIFSEPVILYSGRLTVQKAPEVFIEIAEQILSRKKNVRFVMAGEGPMKRGLIDMAAHKGIGDHIHFTGFVDRDEISKVYAESTIFCMPSISEPFGLSTVEAALAGLPVVISKQSGAAEVLPQALTAEVGNVKLFVQHIFDLIEKKVNTEKITSENRKAAKNLTWKKTSQEVMEVFNRLLS